MYKACILVLSHYTTKGKHQGGSTFFTYTRGCIQITPTMANSLFMDNLPFENVSENVMLDKNRSQNNHCDINSLPSSNNDILTDIDPDSNNLNPNGLKNQCKSYDTSSELKKKVCFENNITMLHTNICSSSTKLKNKLMYYI